MTTLVTGAAGFIGSSLVRRLRAQRPNERLISLDALTYAGNLANLRDLENDPAHLFVHGDIADAPLVHQLFAEHKIRRVFHLAAESHVDRSIDSPMAFVRTNVQGTATLLDAALRAWQGDMDDARFVHVSTDEVFGALGPTGRFDESTPYAPRSPYAATKAASDHLARAWYETWGLPVIVTNCTNNYGPRQFPEKLIPLTITRVLQGEAIPIYGKGDNVRDWLYVDDHSDGLITAADRGQVGATYCFGGDTELSNLRLVELLLHEVDRVLGREPGESQPLIRFVEDRPGHDFRYAIDASRARRELGWEPAMPIDRGLAETVQWYLGNPEWIHTVQGSESRAFSERWYAGRQVGELK